MLLLPIDVLPCPQSTSPRVTDPWFRDPDFLLFQCVFLCCFRLEKNKPSYVRRSPKWSPGLPKWSQKSSKWYQNELQNSSKMDTPRILKTMLSCTRELNFHPLRASRMDFKFDPESGRQKNLSFLRSEGPKMGPGCPKAPKRVSKGSQKRSKIDKNGAKIDENPPKGHSWSPGVPKGSNMYIMVSILVLF